MKKYALILIIFLLILVGCQGTKEDTNAPTNVQVEIAPMTATPAPQETPQPSPSDQTLFVPAVTETPTAEPAKTPAPEPTIEPTDTPEPVERYVAGDGVETVAWMSDTQHYANYAKNGLSPDIYPAMTGFLRDKADKMHLVYVVHTGDLVHVNDNEENWKVARAAQDLLGDIPNGVLAGNHEYTGEKIRRKAGKTGK